MPAQLATAENAATTVASPGVGRFLSAHPVVDAQPLPLPRHVTRGDVVSYIKSGLILRAVRVSADCALKRLLVAEGAGVGYGTPLLECSQVSPNLGA